MAGDRRGLADAGPPRGIYLLFFRARRVVARLVCAVANRRWRLMAIVAAWIGVAPLIPRRGAMGVHATFSFSAVAEINVFDADVRRYSTRLGAGSGG